MKPYAERLYNGIVKENPVFVLMLGMCPTLAVTTSAINGLGMGLSSLVVLAISNLVISLLRNIIPDDVRLPAFIVIVASFVTVVELLMEALEIGASDVEQVFLAGGFGYYLDVEKAARIGLFPAELADKVTAVGNTSLLGTCLYGGDPSLREKTKDLCRRSEVMNLAEQPGFEERYLGRLNF